MKNLFSHVLIALLLSPLKAWAAPPTFCDGKYSEMAEMVDAAYAQYQTLYSSGEHFHFGWSNAGPTIDIYRKLKGYSDLELRKQRTERPTFRSVDPETGRIGAEELWQSGKWLFEAAPNFEELKISKVQSALALDLLTSVGSSPIWWRYPEAFPPRGPREELVAANVKDSPGLEWLEMVVSASDASWNINWQFEMFMSGSEKAAYRSLSDLAWSHYAETGGLEWLVAAALNRPRDWRSKDETLRNRFEDMHQSIIACQATPEEYLAFAASNPQRMRYGLRSIPEMAEMMPATIVNITLENLAVERIETYLELQNRYSSKPDQEIGNKPLENLYVSGNPRMKERWRNLMGLSSFYEAKTVEEIPTINTPYVRRAANLLSTDTLIALSQRSGEEAYLVNAAFARAVALGKFDKADSLLERVKSANPESAEEIEQIVRANYSQSVRDTLIALYVPVSAVICSGERTNDVRLVWNSRLECQFRHNLPHEYTAGAALQRDLVVLLKYRQGAYRGLQGYTDAALLRQYVRHDNDGKYRNRYTNYGPQLLPESPSGVGPAFLRMVDWEESASLMGSNRFMPTVTKNIIDWAEERTGSASNRRSRDNTDVAEALSKVVRECRSEYCGEINGEPAQRRAFELLHYRLPDSEAAIRTPYWWPSKRSD